jgi:microcystin-dependent protein
MSQPFLSEIRIFAFGYAPKGWAFCNGQVLPISQNQALFSLLSTTYGGDGRTTFALPDLRDRTPMHECSRYPLGQGGGEAAHTLTIAEMPIHTHQLNGTSTVGAQILPAGNLLAKASLPLYRAPDNNLAALSPAALANVGGSQPHSNMQPFLTLNFCIALQGIFPSQN